MITANKKPWFEKLFYQYNRQLMKRHFHSISLQTPDTLPEHALVCINHSSWWDGLILFHLNQRILKQDMYAMMHEHGLKKHPFFRKIGAFSVDRNYPRKILQSIKYASELLHSGKTVALFPQGEEMHLETRPLTFMPGAVKLLEENPSVPLLPVVFYYSFGHFQKQEIFIKIGNPLYISDLPGNDRKSKNRVLEQYMEEMLNAVKQDVIAESFKGMQILQKERNKL
ncbi:acyl-phosphate glycerol 3-phosphate acyltransferase [Bacillus lacus]|uniref:Acyl-phosphate glycerol 3-phosphate acyltransferase n=1 Tax=Metabacillus lacus TaxID=1983721 RepID=A0A7X2J139_9BACI|nr:lysophospholipid acyltransferase family protein [Metabacillus lacus]MRX73503.1 acyl-phosphate glycerol 3-phosphate acyltransferase [Metabacillus lacus]